MTNPSPTYTFKVNLPVLKRYSWSLPNRTYLLGNETTTEADNQKATHTSWLTNLFPGCNIIAEHDGFVVTAYGYQAVYLKKLYCSNPPDPQADMLTQLS